MARPLSALRSAVRSVAGLVYKAAGGTTPPSAGEAAFARMAGASYGVGSSAPGGWGGDRAEYVRQYAGWVGVCVRKLAQHTGTVPVAVRVAKRAERVIDGKDYTAKLKSFDADRSQEPPGRRKWVPQITRKGMSGPVNKAEELEYLDDDHPLQRLLNDPNRPDVGASLWLTFSLYYHLCGDAYLWKVRDEAGQVVELWVLPTHWVTPRSQGDRLVDWYDVQGGGGISAKLAADDVIRFYDPSPLHPLAAYSKLGAAAACIDVYNMLQIAEYSALQNGAHLGATIELDPSGYPDGPSLQQFLTKFTTFFGGVFSANRPHVLPPGAKLNRPDAQGILHNTETLDTYRTFVMAHMDCDESMMGFSNEGTYATAVVNRLRLRFDVVKPVQDRLAAVLTERLAAEFGDEFALTYPDTGGMTDPAERRANWQAGLQHPAGPAATVNEVRTELLELEPSDDPEADKLHWNPAFVPPDDGGGDLGGLFGGGDGSGVPTPDTPEPDGDGASDAGPGPPDAYADHPARKQVVDAVVGSFGLAAEKAVPSPHDKPNKSGVFTDSAGRKYRLLNGDRVPVGDASDEVAVLSDKARAAAGDALPKARKLAAGAAARPDAKAPAALANAPAWAAAATKPHAAKVAAKLGIPEDEAHELLTRMTAKLAGEIRRTGAAGGSVTGPGGVKVRLDRKPKDTAATPPASAPRPDSDALLMQSMLRAGKDEDGERLSSELRAEYTDRVRAAGLDVPAASPAKQPATPAAGSPPAPAWATPAPPPDRVTARPKSKAGRKELADAIKGRFAEVKRRLAAETGVKRGEHAPLTDDQKGYEAAILHGLHAVRNGYHLDEVGPDGTARPLDDARYAAAYRATLAALDRYNRTAGVKGIADPFDGWCDRHTLRVKDVAGVCKAFGLERVWVAKAVGTPKAGFTGQLRDSRGRMYYFVNGKRVSRANYEGAGHTHRDDVATRTASQRAILAALKHPERLTAAQLEALAGHLNNLPKSQLMRLRANFRVGGAAAGKDVEVGRLVAHVRGGATAPDAKPAPDSVPPPVSQGAEPNAGAKPTSSDPLDLTPETVGPTWEKFRDEIVSHDPKMSPAQAGSIAAARILNQVSQRASEYIAEIDARVRAGKDITDAEDAKYIAAGEMRKPLARELEKLSGYRPYPQIDEHPLAQRPFDAEPLGDTAAANRDAADGHRQRAAEVAASRATAAQAAADKQRAADGRERAANAERKRQNAAGEWFQQQQAMVGIGRNESLESISRRKRGAVEAAHAAGKPIPDAVKAEYPEETAFTGTAANGVEYVNGVPQKRAGEVTPAPAPPLSSLPPAEFGELVQSTADGHHTGFGSDKVFIHHVYDEMKKQDPSLTREQFDRQLLAAHRARAVVLSRADLVEVMHRDDVRDSWVESAGGVGGDNFNFVQAARRDRTPTRGPNRDESAEAEFARRSQERHAEQQAERATANADRLHGDILRRADKLPHLTPADRAALSARVRAAIAAAGADEIAAADGAMAELARVKTPPVGPPAETPTSPPPATTPAAPTPGAGGAGMDKPPEPPVTGGGSGRDPAEKHHEFLDRLNAEGAYTGTGRDTREELIRDHLRAIQRPGGDREATEQRENALFRAMELNAKRRDPALMKTILTAVEELPAAVFVGGGIGRPASGEAVYTYLYNGDDSLLKGQLTPEGVAAVREVAARHGLGISPAARREKAGNQAS
jgi:hypothetical protein